MFLNTQVGILIKGKVNSTEEIIRILRQADGGETAQSVCREHKISAQTLLRLYGLELSCETKGPWTQRLLSQLRSVHFAGAFHQASFEALLSHHDFLSSQIDRLWSDSATIFL